MARKLAAQNRYRAERPDEDLEEDEIPEGAEADEDDVDAEGEDEDVTAEGEDDEVEAEDEDAPKGKKAKASTRSGFAAERKRCADLTALASQARRLGVKFDAAKAIAKGTSVAAARARILDAAADADAGEISTHAARSAHQRGGSRSLTKEAKAAAWKKAIKG